MQDNAAGGRGNAAAACGCGRPTPLPAAEVPGLVAVLGADRPMKSS